jgi:hypothetical protein
MGREGKENTHITNHITPPKEIRHNNQGTQRSSQRISALQGLGRGTKDIVDVYQALFTLRITCYVYSLLAKSMCWNQVQRKGAEREERGEREELQVLSPPTSSHLPFST